MIHTDEYTSEYQFKKDIDEESSFGTRLRFYLYRGADGNTIDQSFITKMDTPLNVYESSTVRICLNLSRRHRLRKRRL